MSAAQAARLASVSTPTETPARLQLGDILTIAQVAELLQFSKRQVYELSRGESDRDSVRNSEIEGCNPPFAETD
jgi:hypothetical protein